MSRVGSDDCNLHVQRECRSVSPPHKALNCSCPMSKVGNPLNPLQMEEFRLYPSVQMSLCGVWCSQILQPVFWQVEVERGMCWFRAPSAPDNPVIHEWLSPMNLQRLGSSLTGFGAGELWALVNYSCKNSSTVRFSSHPAVADATESQPDPPSGIVTFAPETLGR